jgi:serine/threonine protein kinase
MNLLGQTIGQYQLIEVIHQGENTVYKGFQPSLNRYVAVKILSPAQAGNQAFVQQFQQDMQVIAGLQHANVLPVYEHGQQDGLLYMVTPYIEGGTLQGHLARYSALVQAQQMADSIAGALDYMHSRGVIHGNLKPSNVLVDPQGRPLLADFGYTQGIDVGVQDNVYLSPELAQGGQFDRRTDVYALGALLYEMLLGEPPPLGAVPNPRLRRPDLSPAVEQVILRAMAHYPDQRFQTAGELSRALNEAVSTQAAVASPPPMAPAPTSYDPPAESRGRMSWFVGGLIVVLLALVACVLVLFFFVWSDSTDQGQVEPTPTIGQLPQPVINYPVEAKVGETVTFDGNGSQPGSSPIASYDWIFGDGNTGSGAVVTHIYATAGTYQVTLTVTDLNGFGNTGAPVTITITE